MLYLLLSSFMACDTTQKSENPSPNQEIDAESVDNDGDGITPEDGDCDDNNALVPGIEICDNQDNDCDGEVDEADAEDALVWYLDSDADGFGVAETTTTSCQQPDGYTDNTADCNDDDGSIFPDAAEIWYDGIDQNCDGKNDFDQDEDGYDASDHGGDDCDDENNQIHVGITETYYDGVDADCDGLSDYDQDQDGQDTQEHGGTDCNDLDAAVYQGAEEIWYDGIDQDCDALSDFDQDQDGQESELYGGNDCDDLTATTYLGAPETYYDGIDANCDERSDYDQDNDGQDADQYGGTDCDDMDEDIYLGAVEMWYDGIDQDCDALSDFDQDQDGQESSLYGGSDCDDTTATIYLGAIETYYDGVDSDCDGLSDYDQDKDGQDADQYSGTDCNDLDAAIYQGATEIYYDGIDTNCDGLSDYDQDQDGEDAEQYGGADCDDNDNAINPQAAEIWYDGVDQDCDNADDFDANFNGIDDRIVDLYETPQFVMELYPIGNSYDNALQGLAVDVEQDELWVSVDTSYFYENVLINRLSLQSGNPQYCEEYKESNNLGLGHGQDLSIEYTSSGDRLLWIGSESDRGVTRITPDGMTIEVLSNLLPSGWSHSTPTIGLQNQWIAVRGSKDGDEENNDWIRIYEKSAVESGFVSGNAPSPLYAFNIDAQQRADDMWFQGIALDEEIGVVYAITGDNTLSQSEKLLFVYDLQGNVITSTTIDMDWSVADAMGSKYEPEGLSLVKDPNSHVRYLYFTMMFGGSGNNIKRLYAIAPTTIDLGGSYSNNDIDWLIRYNTNSGEVSIATALKDGRLGCETKRTTWSNGWTSFVGYYTGGDPHLFLQKEIAGTAKIHPLDWDGELDSATKNSSWSDGWDTFASWEHGGSTYLLHYKSGSASSGLMRTAKLTTGGDTNCCYEDENWASGWLTHIYTLPNGDDYLLRYLPSTQNMRLSPLTSGYIGIDIFNGALGTGYLDFVSVQKDAATYVVAINGNGVLSSFAAQSNGQLTAVDTEVTVLSDWSSMLAYNLEGRAVIHLYRASDGFFSLYELNSSGLFEGPTETGFEEMGWTSMQHFRTTP